MKQTLIFPNGQIYTFDFLREGDKPGTLNWNYIYDERMNVPDELEIVDFKGGYYAVITGVDGTDCSTAYKIKSATNI